MSDNSFEPLDEKLIHALQINPRIRWNALAPILGVDAVTLARRWEKLRSSGMAWITGTFSDGAAALIDVSCFPQQAGDVARALAQVPELVTIDYTSGARDIVVTAIAQSPAQIWELATNRIGALPGVRQTQSHLVTAPISEGSSWRLTALSQREAAAVPRPAAPRARAPKSVHPDVEFALRQSLPEDGRRPVSRMAADFGLSEQRVADGLARMIEQKRIWLRTDLSRSMTGWPIYAWYFMRTPAKLFPQLRARIESIPEIRTSLAVASQYNLIVGVWLRDLNQVPLFEAVMEEALPGARIADRSVVFHMVKHMGRLIDDQERATLGFVHPHPRAVPVRLKPATLHGAGNA